MSTMAKYKGKWIPMDRYIQLKQEERGEKVVEKTPEKPLEEKIIEEVVNTPAKTLEELREEYKAVSGKGISPRFIKDKEWLEENIKKYNK